METEKNPSSWKEKLNEKLQSIFEESNHSEYDFSLSSPYETTKTEPSSYPTTEQLQKNTKITEVKEIYSSLEVSLEYIKVKYNTLINSDIVLREFTLSARNRQYKALLFFIDGMVDSQLINNNVLESLMLRNRANIFDGDQNQIVT